MHGTHSVNWTLKYEPVRADSQKMEINLQQTNYSTHVFHIYFPYLVRFKTSSRVFWVATLCRGGVIVPDVSEDHGAFISEVKESLTKYTDLSKRRKL